MNKDDQYSAGIRQIVANTESSIVLPSDRATKCYSNCTDSMDRYCHTRQTDRQTDRSIDKPKERTTYEAGTLKHA